MKCSIAAILALATAAIAAPAPTRDGEHGTCKHVVCVDENLIALDVDLDLNVLGLLDLDLGLDLDVGHKRKCKAIYCCPTECETVSQTPLLTYSHDAIRQCTDESCSGQAHPRFLPCLPSVRGYVASGRCEKRIIR